MSTMNDRLVVLAQMSGFEDPEKHPELEKLVEYMIGDVVNMMNHIAHSKDKYTTETAMVRLEQMLKESYGIK